MELGGREKQNTGGKSRQNESKLERGCAKLGAHKKLASLVLVVYSYMLASSSYLCCREANKFDAAGRKFISRKYRRRRRQRRRRRRRRRHRVTRGKLKREKTKQFYRSFFFFLFFRALKGLRSVYSTLIVYGSWNYLPSWPAAELYTYVAVNSRFFLNKLESE